MNILLTVPNTIFCILDVFSFGNFGLKSSGFLSITPAKRTRWTKWFDTFYVKYLVAWYIWHGLHRRSPLTLFPALHLVFHICKEMLNLLSEYTSNTQSPIELSSFPWNIKHFISETQCPFSYFTSHCTLYLCLQGSASRPSLLPRLMMVMVMLPMMVMVMMVMVAF